MTTKKLDTLLPGESGYIHEIKASDKIKHRLLSLGFLPGEKITFIRHALTGDPIEIKIMGYSLGIRKDEANKIEVTPIT
jgi:Fe2+ transport system protein FeoA